MKICAYLSTFFMLIFCWLAGVEIGQAKINRETIQREQPYRAVMQAAMDGLQQAGVKVAYPSTLPMLSECSSCLNQHEAFGAYVKDTNQIIVPDHFDVTTLEGRSALIHEYGHFLLTQAGVPESEQETLCLRLGNSVMQKFFVAAKE